MRSSLAIEQLKKLDKSNKLRKNKVDLYKRLLKDTSIKIPFTKYKNLENAAYHIFPILLSDGINRKSFIQQLQRKKIQSSIHYPPFWSFSKYKNIFNHKNYPVCSKVSDKQVTLPLYPNITDDEIEYVCNCMRDIIDE